MTSGMPRLPASIRRDVLPPGAASTRVLPRAAVARSCRSTTGVSASWMSVGEAKSVAFLRTHATHEEGTPRLQRILYLTRFEMRLLLTSETKLHFQPCKVENGRIVARCANCVTTSYPRFTESARDLQSPNTADIA